jgi:hypothetical protein
MKTKPMVRVGARVSAEERRMLMELCVVTGQSQAEVCRQAVRHYHQTEFGAADKKRKP